MVFKTVDGHLTNIFSKIEKINTGLNLTGDEIQNTVNEFNKYNSTQSFGEDYTTFLNNISSKNLNVASMFEELAKQGASAKASVEGVYAAILDGNTKGISNVKSVISAFNQIDPTNQQAFASAVGQTNVQLGSYLGGLNGAKASMLGYATETTIATAKTIALRAATMALNVALSWGLSVVISGVIKLVQKAITTQKELTEQAKESAEEINSQVKVLEDLKKKYKEICDSTDDEKTKNEQLDEIKQELINTYKIEKDNLAELNLEREKGLDLLDQEFEKNNRNARNNWLDKNEKAIQKSREKMALSGTDYFSTYLSKDNISESILKLFDKKETFGDTGYVNLEFDYADTVERLEKLKNVYNEILNIKSKRKLTDDEEQLLSEVKSTLNSVQKIYDENYNIYSTAAQYETQNLIENYIKTDTGKLENVGKETFQAWRKGLIEQATNEEERRNIQKYIEQQFPDFTEYFKNIDLANSMFNISDNPTNGFDAGKKSFIEGLSDDDLNIAMQIPDLFADGLSKASEKIAKFNADPNNAITFTFDYSEYSEQVDDIVKNVDKVQTALDKLNGGKTIDSKDITELANAFPDYSTKILSAANDTEKLKSVLREIKSDAPHSLINTLSNLKDLSKEDQEAVNGLINVLSNLNSISSTYSDVLADLETKQSLLSSAYKEMHDDGEVSVGTYQKLIDTGLNYSEAIDIANGKISVNVEKLKELTKEKAKDEILTLRLTKAEIEHNIALNPKNSSLYEDKARAIDEEIKAKQKALELLEGYDYTTTAKKEKDEKPQSVLDFEAEYARRQHEINMGRMKEDEDYYSWLLEAAHTAYDGLEDYQDDLWKYEEEVYKGRKQLADDFYNEQQQDLEDRISALENDIEIAVDDNTDSEGNILGLEEKIDYITSAYQEIINEINSRINDILDMGIEGHEDDVAELEKQIEEYQKKLSGVFDDVFKTAAEDEKEYIENLKDKYSDLYDERINKIKEQKEEAEKAAQAEIDAVQEKIDALKKANDKEQEALDIAKARKELETASQSTRQVYGADGSISFQVDKEKVQEAQENLDKLLLEQQTNILEEQKELLEQAKDKESEAYDNIIENLETEKDNEEKRFDILLEALDKYLNPEQDTSNSEVWKMLSHIEGATYKNGVWSDKDGNAIDLEALIKAVENNTEDNKNAEANTSSSNDSTNTNTNSDTDIVISGNLERLTIGSETGDDASNIKNSEKTETGFDKFLSILEDNLGLKNGTLTLDKITKAFNTSREMGYSPYMALNERMGNAGKGYVNNVNNNNNASNITIGDIVIQNPVGNSDDLAKELALNLPNAFQKQMYTNLAK